MLLTLIEICFEVSFISILEYIFRIIYVVVRGILCSIILIPLALVYCVFEVVWYPPLILEIVFINVFKGIGFKEEAVKLRIDRYRIMKRAFK